MALGIQITGLLRIDFMFVLLAIDTIQAIHFWMNFCIGVQASCVRLSPFKLKISLITH